MFIYIEIKLTRLSQMSEVIPNDELHAQRYLSKISVSGLRPAAVEGRSPAKLAIIAAA
jgi:hypothetical protein